MKGKITNYYAEGNTAIGFQRLYESNLIGLARLFLLKGPPGIGKSTLLRKIGYEWMEKGYDIEFMHSALDNISVTGLILPSLKVGLIDATEPRGVDLKSFIGVAEYVDFEIALDEMKLADFKANIAIINKNKQEIYTQAYDKFLQALVIHDEWEKIYISNIDFNKVEEIRFSLQNTLFDGKTLNKTATEKHRFFGAATPKGSVDFIENLTDELSKRYFIKGRPGTGKSTFLKKIAQSAQIKGFDVEIYHCGFDPNSVDMLIFRELDVAIFDSTSPHEYYPTKDSDEIIDIYKEAVKAGTDEAYETQINEIVKRYKTSIMEATLYLAEAKHLNSELEQIYINATDFRSVERIRQIINLSISRLT